MKKVRKYVGPVLAALVVLAAVGYYVHVKYLKPAGTDITTMLTTPYTDMGNGVKLEVPKDVTVTVENGRATTDKSTEAKIRNNGKLLAIVYLRNTEDKDGKSIPMEWLEAGASATVQWDPKYTIEVVPAGLNPASK